MAALKLKRLIDMDLKPGDLVKFETVHKRSGTGYRTGTAA